MTAKKKPTGTSPHDKVAAALKEIKKIQDLIKQGYAKPEEKVEAFRLAKEAAENFHTELFKRKAQKVASVTHWSKQSKDGFVPADEASQLDGWIALFEEYA